MADGESTAALAAQAGAAALQRAGLDAGDLRLIIVATSTPEHVGFPATACLVQAALGADRAGACDLGAGCSGFLYALVLAAAQVQAGQGPALVVGAEAFSRFLDPDDAVSAPLFGDGAGALVLQATYDEPKRGLLASVLRADGSGADVLAIPAGGARQPATGATVQAREHVLRMDGRRSGRAMLDVLPEAIAEALAAAGLQPSQVDLFVPHDTHARLTRQVVERAGLAPSRVATEIGCLGNTAAASIPIALAAAAERGRLRAGASVLLAAFGAGYAWGSLLWRW